MKVRAIKCVLVFECADTITPEAVLEELGSDLEYAQSVRESLSGGLEIEFVGLEDLHCSWK